MKFCLRIKNTGHTASKTQRSVIKFLGNIKLCKQHYAIKRCWAFILFMSVLL